MLEATFAYRRGGGVVEAEIAARDADTRQAIDPLPSGWTLTLTSAGGEFLQLKATGTPARATIPRERLCALAGGGKLSIALDAPTPEAPPAVFDLGQIEGSTPVVDEACP